MDEGLYGVCCIVCPVQYEHRREAKKIHYKKEKRECRHSEEEAFFQGFSLMAG